MSSDLLNKQVRDQAAERQNGERHARMTLSTTLPAARLFDKSPGPL
jgi:hypothetical protein